MLSSKECCRMVYFCNTRFFKSFEKRYFGCFESLQGFPIIEMRTTDRKVIRAGHHHTVIISVGMPTIRSKSPQRLISNEESNRHSFPPFKKKVA